MLKEEIGSVSKTITFKLNNFVLNYNELYGIANTMQSSGSCTFYSYYNLGINMLLIKALNTEKIKEGIELFIINFIHIHFCMLYLFCFLKILKDIRRWLLVVGFCCDVYRGSQAAGCNQ